MTFSAKKSTGAWCGSVWLSLCLGLNAFAADTTPPTINSFRVGQAVPQDFPTRIAFAYSIYNGPCYDPTTGITVDKAFQITWPTTSNWFYTAWFGPTLTGPWTEWPISTNVHPARVNGVGLTYVPIYTSNKRFYQIRANQSLSITYR